MGVRETFLTLLISLSASNALAGLTATCKDPKTCHPSVAALEILLPEMEAQAVKRKFDYCTGFLIAKDMVLTNSHCVYGRVLPVTRVGKSCSLVSFHFPAVGKLKAEEAECFMIEAMGDFDPRQTEDHPDYMILRLKKPVNRPVISLRKTALKDLEVHRNYAYDFHTDAEEKNTAVQRLEPACLLDMKNDLHPFNEFSPIVFYRNCSVVPGNSGSVMVDSQGQGVSLAMRMVTASGLMSYNGKNTFSSAGTAVNLSCLETFLGVEKDEAWKAKCDAQKYVQFQAEHSENLLFQISQKRDLALNVDEKIRAIKKQYEIYAKIDYKPDDEFDRLHGDYYRRIFPKITCLTKSGAQRFPRVHLGLSSFEAHFAFNKDYRLEYLSEKETPMKLLVEVEAVKSDEVKTSFTVTLNGVTQAPQKITVPICRESQINL